MTVSACARFAILTLCAACTQSSAGVSDVQPTQDSRACVGRAQLPEHVDPVTSSWHLVIPPQGENELGVPRRIDALLDICDSIVSLAHDIGQGGKGEISGPSQLLITSTGESWRSYDISDGASFRDIARGQGIWVVVGQGVNVGGVIAISDASDPATVRQVFQHEQWAFDAVAYGAGHFVAVARDGVAVSEDAEHWRWTQVPSPAQYFDVAFGNGHFVVAGVGATLSSSDGETWEEMQCTCASVSPPSGPPIDYLALQDVRYVGDRFYAYGGSGTLQSLDAHNFTPVPDQVPDAAASGMLVSVANQTADYGPLTDPPLLYQSSDDGVTWHQSRLTLAGSTADCSTRPCLGVPEGVLVFDAVGTP